MIKKFFALLSLTSAAAFAQMTPVGLWHTLDDETNQPKGEVRIVEKRVCSLAPWCAPSKKTRMPNPIATNALMTAKVSPSLAWKSFADSSAMANPKRIYGRVAEKSSTPQTARFTP